MVGTRGIRNLFTRRRDASFLGDLLDQLKLFGVQVLPFEGEEELRSLLSGFRGGVLALPAESLSSEDCRPLLALRSESPASLRLLLVAASDDFALRLRAVRAGGEGYFVLPVDAARVAERVNALSAGEDRPPYHVLLVDDDPEQIAENALVLQDAGMITSVATDPSRVIPLLVEARPDLILMDMYMPGCDGAELAAVIRQNDAFASIPIVFLSVERNLEAQIAAIRRGGDEFLEKPVKPEHLVASVAIRAERTRSLRFFMERDSLTGLLNHSRLLEQLSVEILRSRRIGGSLSFAMIDLDRFKEVNDRHGHLVGDQVLRALARLLSERLRRTDTVGRYGGEEFGIILAGVDARGAFPIMEELRQGFGRLRHRAGQTEFSVSFSCGLASFPERIGAAEVLEAADKALYAAKAAGRDRIRL